MSGVVRWRFSLTWRSLRWIPPLTFQLAIITILCSGGSQPLDSLLAEAAIATLFSGAWVGVTHTGAERSSHCEILDVAVGAVRRVTGTAIAALPFLAVTVIIGVAGPLLFGTHDHQSPATTLAIATSAQSAVFAVGYAIGVAAQRVGGANRAWTIIVVLLACLLILAQRQTEPAVIAVLVPPVTTAAKSVAPASVLPSALWCGVWAGLVIALVGLSYRLRTVAFLQR